MQKAFETKYLEDFAPGDGIESFGVTITDAHLVAWAGLTYDHYPLHMDPAYTVMRVCTSAMSAIAQGATAIRQKENAVFLNGRECFRNQRRLCGCHVNAQKPGG